MKRFASSLFFILLLAACGRMGGTTPQSVDLSISSCHVNGVDYPIGAEVPASDSCNRSLCGKGGIVFTTLIGC